MKQYFKYLTIDELNRQIQNRFSGAKHKIDKINQQPHPSVDHKFYNYVSEIKSKQKQYQSILNEPTELNYLLKKTRSKINQSIDKYQRNLKCKTFSDFHLHPQIAQDRSSYLRNTLGSDKYHQYHTDQSLLQKLKENDTLQQKNNGRSKTQSFFLGKQKSSPIFDGFQKQNKQPKLKSITKVVNITINNRNDNNNNNDKIFSFAKNNPNQKIQQSVSNKKAIRFDTTPAAINQYADENSDRLKSNTCRTLDQICIKKIKQRIKSNYKGCEAHQKPKIKDLEFVYEEETILRIQLKKQILSSVSIAKSIAQNTQL